MSAAPDLTSFRNFSTLNYQNLLYLQAELTHLEESWRKEDEKSRHRHNWAELETDAAWQQFVALRGKLREYNEALIQQHTIAHFEKPSPRSLKALNRILENPSKPEYLYGKDSMIWSDARTTKDLVTVGKVEKLDRTSLLLVKGYLAVKYKLFGKYTQTEEGVIHIEDSRLLFPTKILSVVLSSLLPIAAICVLYVVRPMWQRLIILAAFAAMFSSTLALVTTNSKKLKIFAATATFSAVLVVFISTNTD